MKIISLFLFLQILTGCTTTMPTSYNQMVYITSGEYKGETGRLVGDCPGFENYLIELNSYKKHKICLRIWNMKVL